MKSLERLFFQRPRILNQLHRLRMVDATTQTNEVEQDALAKYARGAAKALEIGSYQGASSVKIAKALAPDGYLICIDPWPEEGAKANPCRLIFARNLRRAGVRERVKVLCAFSRDVESELPADLDFVFIDGDHSWEGIETDWNIVSPRMKQGGIVCLHDTVIPAAESWRAFPSVDYYRQVIAKDELFERVEEVCSMTVLKRRQP